MIGDDGDDGDDDGGWVRSARFYDDLARDYDAHMARAPGGRARAAFRSLVQSVVAPGALLLDFGCGTGIDVPWYLARGHRVIAYDVSAGMMRELEDKQRDAIRTGQVIPWRADYPTFLDELPRRFRPAAVVSNYGPLNHIADLRPLFAALARALPIDAPVVASLNNPFYAADMRRRWWWRALVRGYPRRRLSFPDGDVDQIRHYRSAVEAAARPFFEPPAPPVAPLRLARALGGPLRQWNLVLLRLRHGSVLG